MINDNDSFVHTGMQRTAKYAYIGVSIASIALGIIFLVFPRFSLDMVTVICGALITLFGAVKIVGYFSKDLYRLAFQHDLVFGIVLAVIGIITMIRPARATDFICVVIGTAVLADGILKLRTAISSKKFGIRYWWLILISAAAASILGVLLVIRPSGSAEILTMLLGCSLIAEGILSLCTALAAVRIIKHQRPDVIEGQGRPLD